MSQMTPQQTAQGYTPPSVRQFSVFLENKVGRLLDLVRVFDEAPDVHLCGLSVLESSDHAVVRLIPSAGDAAQRVLRDHGVTFAVLDLLVVELHEGQTISGMCLCLLGAELNIRFAYPLLLAAAGSPTIALAVDDHILAGQILRNKNFRLLGEHDLL
ncbi:MAG: acetolactate synthase [Phycisphaerae bacterium]|nr:acetolactate synthase [Phycisphaerae bacterium]NNF43595.1 acetolactate synthase [Phycisphaerales bacterium]